MQYIVSMLKNKRFMLIYFTLKCIHSVLNVSRSMHMCFQSHFSVFLGCLQFCWTKLMIYLVLKMTYFVESEEQIYDLAFVVYEVDIWLADMIFQVIFVCSCCKLWRFIWPWVLQFLYGFIAGVNMPCPYILVYSHTSEVLCLPCAFKVHLN